MRKNIVFEKQIKKLRGFKNCRLIFSIYTNGSIRCELYTAEQILLACLSDEGPATINGMYVKITPYTENLIQVLFDCDAIYGCLKRRLEDGREYYVCAINRELQQAKIAAFA